MRNMLYTILILSCGKSQEASKAINSKELNNSQKDKVTQDQGTNDSNLAKGNTNDLETKIDLTKIQLGSNKDSSSDPLNSNMAESTDASQADSSNTTVVERKLSEQEKVLAYLKEKGFSGNDVNEIFNIGNLNGVQGPVSPIILATLERNHDMMGYLLSMGALVEYQCKYECQVTEVLIEATEGKTDSDKRVSSEKKLLKFDSISAFGIAILNEDYDGLELLSKHVKKVGFFKLIDAEGKKLEDYEFSLIRYSKKESDNLNRNSELIALAMKICLKADYDKDKVVDNFEYIWSFVLKNEKLGYAKAIKHLEKEQIILENGKSFLTLAVEEKDSQTLSDAIFNILKDKTILNNILEKAPDILEIEYNGSNVFKYAWDETKDVLFVAITLIEMAAYNKKDSDKLEITEESFIPKKEESKKLRSFLEKMFYRRLNIENPNDKNNRGILAGISKKIGTIIPKLKSIYVVSNKT